MSKKIDPSCTPEELDKFLQKKYFISLYCFAVSIVDIFYIRDIRSVDMFEFSPLTLPWREFWIKRIKNLRRIKKLSKESKERWIEFIEKSFPYHQSYPETLQIDKKMRVINGLYKPIDLLIKKIETELLSTSKTKGKPPNPVNVLFLVWYHFMRDRNKAHFQTIVSLMRWFAQRIPDYYFKEEEIEEENLKKEAFRYKRNKMNTTKERVELYVYRFYVFVRYFWTKKNFENIKSNKSIIVFTNEEELTLNNCLENKPAEIIISTKKNGFNFHLVTIDFKLVESDSESCFWHHAIFDLICGLEKKHSKEEIV